MPAGVKSMTQIKSAEFLDQARHYVKRNWPTRPE